MKHRKNRSGTKRRAKKPGQQKSQRIANEGETPLLAARQGVQNRAKPRWFQIAAPLGREAVLAYVVGLPPMPSGVGGILRSNGRCSGVCRALLGGQCAEAHEGENRQSHGQDWCEKR